MPNILDINNKDVVAFTNKLAQMHRSDLPIVVRQTLNDLAFDTKQKTLPATYNKNFIRRSKTFLKSHSGVQKADGWDVNKMHSEVGIIARGEGSEAAEGLTMQEFGGTKTKSMVYMKNARGGSNRRTVQSSKYFNKFQKVKGNPSVKRRSRKSNFIASAIMAHRTGKLLIWDSKSGQTVFLINSIYLGAGNVARVNATPIADYENDRQLRLKARPFLRPASNISFSKQDNFFRSNAIKRFKKKGLL
jgi:hypothetical protein